MAIYHLTNSIIKRGNGRSVIAAAAYRACAKLHDERQGRDFDYSEKSGLVNAEIFVPNGAPAWMKEREQVWNHLDKLERQWNGQTAREIQVALPSELTDEQNWGLAQDFAKQFTDQGMLADVCFHAGNGSEQPHLHILLSKREIDIARGDFLKTKNREWDKKSWHNALRVSWQDLCNRHLVRHGYDIRIDHRSNEARGIRLIPQGKVGIGASKARQLSRWKSDRMLEHEAIAWKNGQAIIADPTIALEAMTAQQSTFSNEDIARLANRQSLDSEHFSAVYGAILASPRLISLGKNPQGQMRYTSQSLLTLETSLLDSVRILADKQSHTVSPRHVAKAAKKARLSPSQTVVLEALTLGSDVVAVVGFAGTGKTHLLGAAREAWEASGYRVQGLALAGKAADGLSEDAQITSKTIASQLMGWKNGHNPLTRNDILVLDEAGMVDSRLMKEVIDTVKTSSAKIVLVGDHTQLQPIGAGASFRAILQRIGFTSLVDIRRQVEPWMRQASQKLAMGDSISALTAYNDRGFVHEYATQDRAIEATCQSWWKNRQRGKDVTATMATFMRKDVEALNTCARVFMRDSGKLKKDVHLKIHDGRNEVARAFAVGDEIYFLKGDSRLNVAGINEEKKGVKNGTRGVITALTKRRVVVKLDEKTARTIAFSLKDYSHFDHAYASTVHKLQGANFDHTDYLLSFNSNRYLEHVGMTRHKKSLNIHYSKEQFRKGYDTVQTFFGREAIKDMTVDYTGPEDIDSSLIDIESQLAQTVNQDVVDDWLDAVDFAALEKADCEALTPLLNAKAQYDNVSQHYAKESEAYRMAQANLVATALALRDNAQRQAILANIDAAQVTALTAHPLLNNLVQPRREVANGITAPDENFHAFLSSFDWKSIEQHKAEHIVLQDLFETKLAYEAAIVAHQHNALRTVADRDFKYEKAVAKELQSPDVTKERTTLLEILDVVANNETVHAQVTAIDNSIVEPLAEFKAMQERQELAKEVATLAQAAAYAENQSPQPPAPSMSPSETPNNEEKKSLPTKEPSFRKDFEAWYQSVDWNSIAEQKGYRFENLNSAVTLYEKVKTGDNLAATKRTEEKIIQRCALILEKTSKAELAQSLSPSAFNALTHYELEFKHERERHQHHSREISR